MTTLDAAVRLRKAIDEGRVCRRCGRPAAGSMRVVPTPDNPHAAWVVEHSADPVCGRVWSLMISVADRVDAVARTVERHAQTRYARTVPERERQL